MLDAYLFPRLWPMHGDASTGWTIAAAALLLAAVLLFVWRTLPALTGRHWRTRPRNDAHLHRFGQRLADVVGPIPLLVFGIGALQRDWAWYIAGAIVLTGWLGGVMITGFTREQIDPTLPKTTSEIIAPHTEPIVEPRDDEHAAGTSGPIPNR